MREIYTITNTTENSSLTSILCTNISKNQSEQTIEFQAIEKEIISLSSTVLELNDRDIKFNKIDCLYGLTIFFHNSLCKKKVFKFLQYKLFDLLVNLRNMNDIDKKFGEFDLQRDCWDKYEILDSKYYLPILLTNRILSEIQQILLVNFVISSVENGKFKRKYLLFGIRS